MKLLIIICAVVILALFGIAIIALGLAIDNLMKVYHIKDNEPEWDDQI